MDDETLIEDAIRALDVDDKVRLLSGAASFALAADDRIGLASIRVSDGPTGVRGDVAVGGRKSCLLPNASLLAQTWSTDAFREVGEILAEEAIDQKIHVVLGPTINLHRSPLGGRLFEALSEDPLLTGHLAAAYVRGLQDHHIGAGLKHFVGNESETERTTVNAVMSPETLREVYLKPFEIAIHDANPWTLMAAYNRVNGVACTEHRDLLEGVVKNEWGYDGLVMSDWFGTSSSVDSVSAGLDLVMPGPVTPWSSALADEVRDGKVSIEVVDEHVRRVLRLATRVGALGTARSWGTEVPRPDSERRRSQLTELAARGMVVLKNERQALPLIGGGRDTIVVIGRHGVDTIAQGGGSAQVRPPHVVSIAAGVRAAFGEDRVSVVDGVETRVVLPAATPNRVVHPITGERGIRARVFDDRGAVTHDVHLDTAEIEDSKSGWLADAARIELSARVQLPEAMSLRIGVRGPGRWHICAPGHDEIVEIPFHRGPGGGFYRPRSHAKTLRLEPDDLLVATVERTELPRILGLVVAEAPRPSAAAITRAVEAASSADVAVVVVGTTPDQETEGQDKRTLSLPGHQDALVAAVAGAARRTVVVVNAATPTLMPWADAVDAILFVGLPGQEAGHAVAAALRGDVLPEGRLVTTFPNAEGEGPAWSTTPVNGDLPYREGLFIGHRGWYTENRRPAYWFGHGLGLTTWGYSMPAITSHADDGTITQVEITICNVGGLRGRETIQVYFDPSDPQQPVRLVGWAQQELEPDAAARVSVRCDPRLQRRWKADGNEWIPLTEGTLLIGRGLGDIRDSLGVASDTHPGSPGRTSSEPVEV